MTKTCITCQKEFETEKDTQLCCSGACLALEKKRKALERVKAKKKKKPVKRKPITPLQVNLTEFTPAEPEIEEELFPSMTLPKSPEPWIKEIKAYCEEAGIIPQDLIEFHKTGTTTGNKPAKKKDSDNLGLTYFQQLQNRKSFGK